MRKLSHVGKPSYVEESERPALKREVWDYLKGKVFQRAFQRMVSKSIGNGTEHGFGTGVGFTPDGYLFKASKLLGGYSPDGMGLERAIDAGRVEQTLVPQDLTFIEHTLLVISHTHPYEHQDPYAILPSPEDVETLNKHRALFGLVVPVNFDSREIGVLAFQPVGGLSHVPYGNLMEELGYLNGEEFSRMVLDLAARRSILRIIEFATRKKAALDPAEIGRILHIFEFRPIIQKAWQDEEQDVDY
ncbi:hypothetical protein H0O00_02010 [Candidatus Micrarchaeota archaeon]|nr:hypothetical protein [Candidatus Micrarchaeota archaeon]